MKYAGNLENNSGEEKRSVKELDRSTWQDDCQFLKTRARSLPQLRIDFSSSEPVAELPFTLSACWFETSRRVRLLGMCPYSRGQEREGGGELAAAISANKDVTSNGHTGLMSAVGMTNNSINLPQHGLTD